jgi:hypothetical protein
MLPALIAAGPTIIGGTPGSIAASNAAKAQIEAGCEAMAAQQRAARQVQDL